MRPVSSRFLAATRAPHIMATQVEVLLPTGAAIVLPGVMDGTVTLDANADTRGRLDLTLVDDGTLGLIPVNAADLLAPFGNEVRASRGIQHADDTVELVSLGVFRIETCDVDDSAGDLRIQVSGGDRSARVIDATFEEPWQIAAGTETSEAILSTIQQAWPAVPHNIQPTTEETPQLLAQEGGDRWAFVCALAQAIGLILYFDGDGILQLAPSRTGVPVEGIAEGENGVLLKAVRNWSRQGVRNRWIVTGENSTETAPVRAVATDEDPQSPTYYHGPFGKCPAHMQSSAVKTTEQAQSLADSLLAQELQAPQRVSWGSIVNPALEPGDVTTIRRAITGIDEPHVIQQLAIPLSNTQPMTSTARATDHRVIRALQSALAEVRQQSTRMRRGVVTSTDPLSVALAGADIPYTNLKALDPYLQPGDVVNVMTAGNDMIVTGVAGDQQAPPEPPPEPFTMGADSVSFAGGTKFSSVETISHGLGVTPANIQLTPTSQSTTGMVALCTEGKNDTTFTVRGQALDDTFNPPGGSSTPFDWVAFR